MGFWASSMLLFGFMQGTAFFGFYDDASDSLVFAGIGRKFLCAFRAIPVCNRVCLFDLLTTSKFSVFVLDFFETSIQNHL